MKTVGKAIIGLGAFMVVMVMANVAFAQDNSVAVALADRDKWIAAALALGVAIAAFGGALGQGRAAAAAFEGISRNPSAYNQIFTPMIIGLALIESLVIYSLVVFFMLQGKIH